MRGDTTAEITIYAEDVREGMSLVDMDYGYVVDVEPDPELSYGRYNARLGDNMVMITFHDAEGNENYLLLQKEFFVTVNPLP